MEVEFDREEIPSEGLFSDLCDSLGKRHCTLTLNGRSAIAAILGQLGVCREDEVWITTSHELPNVSSCVTCTIFNVCKPSRVLTSQTRAIFAIHEFGVPHPKMPDLRRVAADRGIPLIEDCAHTIDSRTDEWRVGELGDFVVLSFPKLFPCRSGGAVLGPKVSYSATSGESREMCEMAGIAAQHWADWPRYANRRREIFRELTTQFQAIGLAPLFTITDKITPWFFPVPTRRWREMRESAQHCNVDCGLWHGSDIVVFPCHQYLDSEDVRRIRSVAEHVLNETPE
jgi:hypothetical protein